MSFDDNCIKIIKELMGTRLAKDARKLVKIRSMSMHEYIEDLEQEQEDFGPKDELQFIDKDNDSSPIIVDR